MRFEAKLSLYGSNSQSWQRCGIMTVEGQNTDVKSLRVLTRIEPHRLMALIEEDLRRNPWSSFGEIHQRIAGEYQRTRFGGR